MLVSCGDRCLGLFVLSVLADDFITDVGHVDAPGRHFIMAAYRFRMGLFHVGSDDGCHDAALSHSYVSGVFQDLQATLSNFLLFKYPVCPSLPGSMVCVQYGTDRVAVANAWVTFFVSHDE